MLGQIIIARTITPITRFIEYRRIEQIDNSGSSGPKRSCGESEAVLLN